MRLLPGNARLSGTIDFSGRNIVAMHEEEIRKLRGSEISMIFQEPLTSLNPLWKVGRQIDENLKMHTELKGDDRFQSVVDIMRRGAARPGETIPQTISRTVRRNAPDSHRHSSLQAGLIIADEPTTAPTSLSRQIHQLLKDINREGLLHNLHFTTSHNKRYAHRSA